MRHLCLALFVLSALGFVRPALAEAARVVPVGAVGLEFGGETLVDLTYSDGSKSSLKAGNGFLLSGGVVIDWNSAEIAPIQSQITLGFKGQGAKEAKNGDVSFFRFPAELLVFYCVDRLRLGGGLTYQFGNRLRGTKDAAPLTTEIENALGFVAQADYLFGPSREFGVGLRYTAISYRPELSRAQANGQSLGLTATFLAF